MANEIGPLNNRWELVDSPDHGAYSSDHGDYWVPDEPPHDEGGVPWRRYIAALRRYKWLILAIVLVGGVLGVVAARMVQPQYVARSTVWITNSDRPQQQQQGPIRSEELLRSYAWLDLIRSYIVLDPVVTQLGLYLSHPPADSAFFAGFQLDGEFVPGRYRLAMNGAGYQLIHEYRGEVERGSPGDPVGRSVGFVWSPPASAFREAGEVRFTVVTPREAAVRLSGKLEAVLPTRDGNFMEVQLAGTDPRKLARTVNAVNDHFVEVAADLKRAKLDELTEILNEQRQQAEQNLMRAEEALESFRVRTITEPSDPSTPVAPGLEMTQDPALARFFDMRVEREALRQERQLVQDVLEGPDNPDLLVQRLEVIQSVQGSTELTEALNQLVDQRATLRAFLRDYTEEHELVRDAAQQVRRLEQEIIPRLARNVLASMRTREATIEQRLDAAANELRQIPPRAIEEGRLRRDRQIKEDLFTVLEQRYEEARLAAVSSIPDVRILDPAVPPRQPVNSGTGLRLLLMAIMGSFGLAVAGVIVWDRFDPRLRYPEQVSDEMGLPIIGVVAHAREGRRLFGRGNLGEVREAFRSLRLNLLHSYGSAGPVVLAVSSPGKGDGKSFISQNLARGFADLGRRTLLVDGDVRRGHLHRSFDQKRVPGIIDFLSDRASLEDVIRPTAFPGLDFIATGSVQGRAPELLASPELRAALVELRARYDVIIIDTPPLGAGVDPFILGTLTGNMLLVMRTGETDRMMASAQLDALRRLPIRILGGVLNGVETVGPYRYYAYLPDYELPEGDDEAEPEQLVTATTTGE